MKPRKTISLLSFALSITLVLQGSQGKLFAHCDGLDGPVVRAAQRALETGNVNLVLIWVQKQDESEVRSAFQKTLAVRKLSSAARDLSDLYFFETVVRIHRAGEGAPYGGLKPAGQDLGPAIPAADTALETGSVEALLSLVTGSVQTGIREHFDQVMAKKNFNKEDVGAGQQYVKAYVEFIHYVERLYEVSKGPAAGHFHEPEKVAGAIKSESWPSSETALQFH